MKKPWYRNGLCFECTQCGNCCSGAPGLIVFEPGEGEAMARQLGLSYQEFLEQYALPTEDGWTLREVPAPNGIDLDCVLLERGDDKALCRVHGQRPAQCRSWPFWPGNLRSPRTWQRAGRNCEGIDRGGRVSFHEIQRQVKMTPEGIGPR